MAKVTRVLQGGGQLLAQCMLLRSKVRHMQLLHQAGTHAHTWDYSSSQACLAVALALPVPGRLSYGCIILVMRSFTTAAAAAAAVRCDHLGA
jgi:hypothetical protein